MDKAKLALVPLVLASATSCRSISDRPAVVDPIPIPSMQCRRAAQPITIDGRLDDTAWEVSQVVELRINPSGTAPTHRTRARSLWDDQYLYFAFEAEAFAVTARMTNRDDPLFNDTDVVEVFLSPSEGAASFFEFEVNPLNALLDLFFTNRDVPWPTAAQWNADGIRTAVHIARTGNERVTGWTTEIAIPWKNFHSPAVPPPPGATWRVNFCRCETIPEVGGDRLELCAWSSTLDRHFNWPERFGRFHFAN